MPNPDWLEATLGEIGRFRGGTGFPLRYQGSVQGKIPFFKVSDMNLSGNELQMTTWNNSIDAKDLVLLGAKTFDAGTIIFAKVGAAIFLERKRLLCKPSCLDNNMAGFTLDGEENLPQFFYHWFQNFRLASLVATTALPSINNGQLRKITCHVPPEAEQSLIARALDDADSLLITLGNLIAKKRAIKQGAVQQLLSAKTRLPGFDADWLEGSLGKMGHVYGGLSGKSKQDFGTGASLYIPFVNVMANLRIDPNALESVSVAAGESQNSVMFGDLIFNGSSETPEEVGLASVVDFRADHLYLNSFCFGFHPNNLEEVDSAFLAYLFRSQVGRQIMYSLAQGSTRYNLSKPKLLAAKFQLPHIDEQRAIAQVLTDMDAEIDALVRRREKTAFIKTGMMQELLTGRTRLV